METKSWQLLKKSSIPSVIVANLNEAEVIVEEIDFLHCNIERDVAWVKYFRRQQTLHVASVQRESQQRGSYATFRVVFCQEEESRGWIDYEFLKSSSVRADAFDDYSTVYHLR